MGFLTDLWLPILLSAMFVFIASSVLHMAIPIHKNDCKKLPNEDEVLTGLRTAKLTRGSYVFPCPGSMKDMGGPAMLEKYKRGPVGFMTVLENRPFAMGKGLAQWLLYCLLVSVFAAYVTSFALTSSAEYLDIFRLAGTTAVLAYCVGNIPNSIWKGQSWLVTAKFIFDGVIYSLVTAGTFGWLHAV